jgi:Ca2+-binding EF-hand superfamily protein
MRFSTIALMALGAAALAACATGRSSANEREPIRALLSADALMYATFDADRDLRLTMDEVQAGVAMEFTRADANRDGSLQPIEFQNWSNLVLGGGSTGPYRLDFDRNVDNLITAEEFTNELTARARDYDADEDGVIVRGDFIRVIGQARQPGAQRRPAPDGRPGGG